MWIFKFFKQLFCTHVWKYQGTTNKNIIHYPDQIIIVQDFFRCEKCEKTRSNKIWHALVLNKEEASNRDSNQETPAGEGHS